MEQVVSASRWCFIAELLCVGPPLAKRLCEAVGVDPELRVPLSLDLGPVCSAAGHPSRDLERVRKLASSLCEILAIDSLS